MVDKSFCNVWIEWKFNVIVLRIICEVMFNNNNFGVYKSFDYFCRIIIFLIFVVFICGVVEYIWKVNFFFEIVIIDDKM